MWLANGERGLSSETMFTALTGVDARDRNFPGIYHPWDTADFWRCENLLRKVPELRPNLPMMAQVSQPWKRLVEHWDAIVASFEAEIPGIFSNPNSRGDVSKTYALIKQCVSDT